MSTEHDPTPEPEKTCFVISPIGEPDTDARKRSDTVLKHIIAPAARDNGLEALRADKISAPGIITTHVIRHILDDKMVVADLSNHNPNVFYELALRHAFQKPVVLLILEGQPLPFDVLGLRTIRYSLDVDGVSDARDEVTRQIRTALDPRHEAESPVAVAALPRQPANINELIVKTMADKFADVNEKLEEVSQMVRRTDELNEEIRQRYANEVDLLKTVVQRYAGEIDLLKTVRHAGVVGIFKRREMACGLFARALDDETKEVMVIGSSLKGLLQKDEYVEIAAKLRFKTDRGLSHVKFLLTHPIFADFRANQENRSPTEIGHEIIASLQELQRWNRQFCHVRLYLGTPTCFAIKTTRKMLINPYPYISTSYNSPCLILDALDAESMLPAYFFDEFNALHFGAWESNLSVRVTDFDRAIKHFSEHLDEYAGRVKSILDSGKDIG